MDETLRRTLRGSLLENSRHVRGGAIVAPRNTVGQVTRIISGEARNTGQLDQKGSRSIIARGPVRPCVFARQSSFRPKQASTLPTIAPLDPVTIVVPLLFHRLIIIIVVVVIILSSFLSSSPPSPRVFKKYRIILIRICFHGKKLTDREVLREFISE